jgi:hypothetical protein
MIRHVGRCPDLLGPAGALLTGHETKKDISMLTKDFILINNSGEWQQGHVLNG